jgi:hypothetical protein
MIDELIATVAQKTGLQPAQVRTALAGAISLVRKHADGTAVEALLDKVPGLDALADEGPKSGGGGMLGGMMKGLGGAGGGAMADGMALMQNLAKDGVSAEDLKLLVPVATKTIQEKTGHDVLGDALKSIPGVGGMLSQG